MIEHGLQAPYLIMVDGDEPDRQTENYLPSSVSADG